MTSTPRRTRGPLTAVRKVALREITEHVRSARFLMIALLVLGLTPLAVFVGVRDYEARRVQHRQLVAAQQEVARGPAGKRIRGLDTEAERILLRAFREPEPFSPLVRGLDAALPQYWEFTSTGIEAGPSASAGRRLGDVLGHLDLEFLVRVVLGLLAILLAFDSIVGEKESGTLRAVLSRPVPRSAFVAGKLIGGAVTLLVPLAVAFLLALVSARLLGMDFFVRGTLLRVALLALTSSLYLFCLYGLGLLVSSLAGSQKTALVVLLVTWVFMVLAVPPTSTLVAHAVAPTPPRYLLAAQKRALDKELRRETHLRMGDAYLRISGLRETIVSADIFRRHRGEMEGEFRSIMSGYLAERRRRLGTMDRRAERQERLQERVARALMMLSPAGAYAGAAASLAGTGDAQYEAWRESLSQHGTRLDRALFEDPPTLTLQVTDCCSLQLDLEEPRSPAGLPAFPAPARDPMAGVARALPDLLVLLVYTALSVLGGFLVFRRYDVR